MSRNVRLAGAASATATVALAITASGASGIGPSLPVQAPSAPVQVQSPALPSVPAAPVKVPAAPAAPSVPSAPAASGPAASAPPLPGVAAVVAVSQAPRAAYIAAPGRATGGSSAAAAGSGSASGSAARSGAAVRARAHERAAAETRRLRSEVRRLRGCLGNLPELERHLLAMRVGLGGPAMTRRAAAKQLQISVGRAHRLERRGLRELRSESRRTGCGPQPQQGFHAFTFNAATTTVPSLHPVVNVGAAAPTVAAAPSPGAKPQRPRQGVLGETAKSPPPTGGRSSAPPVGSAVSPNGSSGGHGLVIALVLLLLAANLLVGGLWLLRKRRRSEPFVYEPGSRHRREYGDPNRELDFGTPERPQPRSDDSWEPTAGEKPRDGES